MATRTVVITGCSTGIGEACALRLDRIGWNVFAGVRRDADGEALRSKASDRLKPVILDVADSTTIEAAAKEVRDAVGAEGLAGLVNNAGISVGGPLEFIPLDDVRRQLEVNVTGQIATTQAFLELLRTGKGRVVNIGSIGGRFAVPFAGPYTASKYAMEGLTDCLRMELSPWGIHVSIVEPASVATPIWEKGLGAATEMISRMPPRAMELYGAAVPTMRTLVEEEARIGIAPDEVAKRVAHALTAPRPKTRYVLGKQARLRVFLTKFVPDRMRDSLVFRITGLPR